jgi:predicted transcriptional regulator
MSSPIKVLVDSTFLLPSLGIKVAQISDSDLRELAKLQDRTRFFCIHQSLVELLGKVGKEWASTSDEKALETIEEGLRSLLESGVYTWISPSAGALVEAVKLRKKGHKDMIDNILYSTATHLGMSFLSLNRELIKFLEEHQYSTKAIVDIKKLRSLIQHQ